MSQSDNVERLRRGMVKDVGLKSTAVGRRRPVTAFAGTRIVSIKLFVFFDEGRNWAFRPTAVNFSSTSLQSPALQFHATSAHALWLMLSHGIHLRRCALHHEFRCVRPAHPAKALDIDPQTRYTHNASAVSSLAIRVVPETGYSRICPVFLAQRTYIQRTLSCRHQSSRFLRLASVSP